MPAELLVPCEGGGMAFEYSQDTTRYRVEIEFTRPEDQTYFKQLVESRLMSYYVGPFCASRVEGRLKKFKIFYVQLVDGIIDSVFAEVTIVNTSKEDGPVEHTTPLLLRCPSAAVLVVFRTHAPGPDGSSRPREFVAFVQARRRAVSQGYPDSPEIPCGRFGPNQRLQGQQISVIEKTCNIVLVRPDLDHLSNRLGNNWGVNTNPATACDNIELYLYRKTISDEEVEQMQSASPDENGYSIQLVPLGNAWRSTSDLKSLAGLFFFHEYRYHNRMPRYTPPTGYVPPPRQQGSQPTRWSKVQEINPNGPGYSLVVKVHKPLQELGTNRGMVVVGDETGIVQLLISGAKPNNSANAPNLMETGTFFTIQNARVDLSSGHIRLQVPNWGRLGRPSEEQESAGFEVNVENDMSADRYALAGGGPGRGVTPRPRQPGPQQRGRGRGNGRPFRGRGPAPRSAAQAPAN